MELKVLVLYGISATRIGDQEHLGPWGGLRLFVACNAVRLQGLISYGDLRHSQYYSVGLCRPPLLKVYCWKNYR